MSIGDQIRKRRKSLGMTVEQLATAVGKNKATIYRYEKGDIENLPTTVLEPIALALKTTPQFLMGWLDDPVDYEEWATSNTPPDLFMPGEKDNYRRCKEWYNVLNNKDSHDSYTLMPLFFKSNNRIISIRLLILQRMRQKGYNYRQLADKLGVDIDYLKDLLFLKLNTITELELNRITKLLEIEWSIITGDLASTVDSNHDAVINRYYDLQLDLAALSSPQLEFVHELALALPTFRDSDIRRLAQLINLTFETEIEIEDN